MPRLFRGNFDFEFRLTGDRPNLPKHLRRRNAELACCWLTVAEDGDVIWCPQPLPEEFLQTMAERTGVRVSCESDRTRLPTGLAFVPWGWSEQMVSAAATIGAKTDAPPLDVVRRANSRRFSLSRELASESAPVGTAAVESLSELDAHLKRLVDAAGAPSPTDARCVLKAEFSHAARERLLIRGRELDERAARWAAKRLKRDRFLVVEPWLTRLEEAGIQWSIPRVGSPRLEGVTPLLTAPSGEYRGSRFGVDGALARWESAVAAAEEPAALLQRQGYFGPLGIDAARYRDASGAERLRPFQDINARWTMGRLSLGWTRIAPSGTWRHGPRSDYEQATREPDHHVIATSPETIGDHPVRHHTWLELPSEPV